MDLTFGFRNQSQKLGDFEPLANDDNPDKCSRLQKVGTWMQDDLCWFSFFLGFGFGDGHVPTFWLLLPVAGDRYARADARAEPRSFRHADDLSQFSTGSNDSPNYRGPPSYKPSQPAGLGTQT